MTLITSVFVDYEVLNIPDGEKRRKVYGYTELKTAEVDADEQIENRAKALELQGFRALDALHIACAERANVEVLLTTDDRFLRRAQKEDQEVQVKVENPLQWLLEMRERI